MDIVEELRTDREKGARHLESEFRVGLMSLARRLCRNESDAEELVNSTFAEVVESIDNYVEQSAFFACPRASFQRNTWADSNHHH